MICVLMVASGAAWESSALEVLAADGEIVVLKRCVDVSDLLASAAAGQADVAVLALDAPGLDLAAVEHLRRHQVRPVAVVPDAPGASLDAARARAHRIGLHSLVPVRELAALAAVVTTPERDTLPGGSHEVDPAPPPAQPAPEPEPASGSGAVRRVVAVWGPAGAPGRTTVASGVAALLAARGERTVLVDADPWGGAVAQHYGILDEASGLLAAARLSASGELTARFAGVQRAIDERLTVITGLPRPDRWVEVRSGALEHLLEVARGVGQVVVDVGFCLEEDTAAEFASRPGRNTMTLGSLAAADEIVVVGAADPVGLARLGRGLVELRELGLGKPLRVVVNRMRPSLGWSEKDIAAMVEGFARVTGLHFLPDDRSGVDRALIAGRSLVESGESTLRPALEAVVDALVPGVPAATARPGFSLRRAGTALRR